MLGSVRGAWWSALLVLFVAIAAAAGCGSSGSSNGAGGGTDAGSGDDATSGGQDGSPIGFGGDASSSLTITPQNPVLSVSKPGVTLQFKGRSRTARR